MLALPSRQCKNYYYCLLRGIAVGANNSSQHYRAILDANARLKGNTLELLALEDCGVSLPLPIENGAQLALQNDDGVLIPQPVQDAPPAPHRPTMPRSGLQRVGRSSGSNDPVPGHEPLTVDVPGTLGGSDDIDPLPVGVMVPINVNAAPINSPVADDVVVGPAPPVPI